MKPASPLLLASLCTLALAVSFPDPTPAPILYPRQSIDLPVGGNPSTDGQQQPSQSAPPPPPPSSVSEPPPQASSTPPPNNVPSAGSAEPSNSKTTPDPQPSPSNTPPPNPSGQQSAPVEPSFSLVPTVVQETDEAGSTYEVTKTISASYTPSSSASATPPTESKGLSTGSIVGMSIAGGVAVIGIVGFFVWKFTRKRITDFDDNEAIKWPELNTHGEQPNYALPTNATGRSGFGSESDVNLSRTASASTGFAGGADPYAVPPLPHANPNQPYRDDPGASYYDPYSGPVPHTFSDATSPHDEAIPMSSIRTRSPGPGMAYETGRASPAPSMGRQSPSPYMAYGDSAMGRHSPAPHMAYADSPAMQARTMSPAPGYGGGYSR